MQSNLERVNKCLAELALHNGRIAAMERYVSNVRECMEGEHGSRTRAMHNRFLPFESIELARMNEHRAEPRWSLPDSAYEARNLMRYLPA